MADSYRKINYSLRPAKAIERKMFIESIRRLSEFGSLDSYRYIGFGSIYFSDFSSFHKSLGLETMLSIERDKPGYKAHKERFEFNKPYGFIHIEFGDSWSILPAIPWAGIRTVLWLDYDGAFDQLCLRDVSTFFSSAVSGSMIAISFNVQDQFDEDGTTPLQRLAQAVGETRVPRDLKDEDLVGWNRAEIFRQVIDNEIAEILARRNGGLPPSGKMIYRQLFNFRYQDGAMMVTIGGVLYDKGQEGSYGKCMFDSLEFHRPDSEPYKIDVPCLTFREIRKLDSLIPISESDYSEIPIPSADIAKYQKIYRYFPTFTEAEL